MLANMCQNSQTDQIRSLHAELQWLPVYLCRMKLTDQTRESTGFVYRGLSPSRLEGFTDAVFAFAITLLVVSLEVPKTYAELKSMMAGFIGFAFCFAMLVLLWFMHQKFFRRYGLHDTITMVLNSALLFILLFYVYPLKFVFTLTAAIFFGPGVLGDLSDVEGPIMPADAGSEMMTIYGLGFAAVFFLFFMLYRHAWALRDVLHLTPVERWLTREELWATGTMATIGLLSVLIAWLPFPAASAWAGFFYFLIGPAMFVIKYVSRSRLVKKFPERELPAA